MAECWSWRALLVALAWLALASPADAQHTGGSAGSSGFGGGSSSSSSSSGGSFGSSGSGGSSSAPAVVTAATYAPPAPALGTSYLSGRGPQIPASEAAEAHRDAERTGTIFAAAGCPSYCVFSGALIALALAFTRRKPGSSATSARGAWEVRRLSIAFDWTARARIQQALDEVTRTTSIADDAGRRVLLDRVAALMGESIGAARYAMFQSFAVGPAEAEQRFLGSASDLRARFKKETRGARALDAAPVMRARADEGEGLVVVSVVAAFDRHLFPLPRSVNAESLLDVLPSLGDGSRVVALEVVWSPAEELDRLSSAELELFYPELLRVDSTSTDVGRLACTYCSAIYPAEIRTCPACGAPAPAGPTRP